mmetsp:Transcript_23029/g.26279  ORF Transcript_23029/g.26279 Transcript_23029/m.26279 type:complete len:172 (+) Transcript_23029:156-671(+)
MNTSIFFLCAILSSNNFIGLNAFTVPSSYDRRLQYFSENARSIITSSKNDESSELSEVISIEGGGKGLLNESMHQEWIEQLQSSEIQEVRAEMVNKFLSFGKTAEEAEKEVDKFLCDPEQSLQYLEMRQYAKEQQLVGSNVESIMSLAGAFALGLIGTMTIKYFDLGQGPF